MNKQRLLKMIGPVLLVLAIGIAVVFMKTKPKAQRKPMSSMIPVVTAMALQPTSTPVRVSCLGTVISDREAAIEAEVNGRIVEMNPKVVEGDFVSAGDWLLTIDSRDYELAVDRAQAAVRRAESSLLLEKGQQSVAKHEMKLIADGAVSDPSSRDLMLRVPQLKTAQANLKTAQADLAAAKLNLERTKITAPFDGVVQMVSVSTGDFARGGKSLVTLVATDRFFVRVSLPVSDLHNFPTLEKMGYSAEVDLGEGGQRAGTIYRLMPGLSEQGRMARLLIAVDNPLSAGAARPMLLDEVVRVNLFGEQVDGVCLIARKHLRAGSTIWMVDETSHLQILPVEVVQGYADQVLVRVAVSNAWKMVTSNMPTPVAGMEVRLAGAKPAPREVPPTEGNGKGRL